MVATLVVAVVVTAAGGLLAGGGSAPAQADPPAGAAQPAQGSARVVVDPGETAWEALRPHRPAGVDHAVFVHEVMSFNEVDARELRPGEVLRVPAAPAG